MVSTQHRMYRYVLLAASLMLPASLTSQNTSFPNDSDIPTPSTSGKLGQLDAPALTEVVNHMKTVGASSWTGIQGTGQIVYGTSDKTAYAATLSVMADDKFRLDAQTSTGPMSIRIGGRSGKVQGSDGKLSLLHPETAAYGLVQFELPRLTHFPYPGTSLFIKEVISVDGAALQRVAYEFYPLQKGAPSRMTSKTAVTDLYFDTGSHLLIKTATSILLPESHNNPLLQVVTYGDYRKVGSSLVPFRYTQTLNGQLQWSLQLASVQLNPALDSTFFKF